MRPTGSKDPFFEVTYLDPTGRACTVSWISKSRNEAAALTRQWARRHGQKRLTIKSIREVR